MRAQILSGLYRLAETALTEQSGFRSLYLACSQFYADEAGDAVHESLTVAPTLWPSYEDLRASYERIDSAVRWGLAWDSNEDAVYAFAPMCKEEGYGDEDFDEDSEPSYEEEGATPGALAIVQRLDSGELRATWLGTLHRPWLDFPGAMKDREEGYGEPPRFVMDPPAMPALVGREQALYDEVLADPANYGIRDVLADQWMLRNDPRGELTALTTSKHPTDEQRRRAAELVLAHGRGWLGPLAKVVPLSGALFGPGPFVRKAVVYATDRKAIARVADAPQWATVEELTFANQSKRFVSTAMKNLRSVGPLSLDELAPLRTGSWQIRELEVELGEDDTVEALARLALPLARLRLRIAPDAEYPALEALARAPWWQTLERIEIWERPGADFSHPTAAANIFEELGPQVREGCGLASGVLFGGMRSGWIVVGGRQAKRLELVRPDARLDQVHELSAALGLAVPSEPFESDDWLTFGLGVARGMTEPAT